MRAAYLLSRGAADQIYGPQERSDVAGLVDVVVPPEETGDMSTLVPRLGDTKVVLSGWGAPSFDTALLDAMPRLRIVLYGAGSIRRVVTDAFWERDIAICSAWGANAVPVAEYSLSQILFCLKRGWYFARAVREARTFVPHDHVIGAYRSVVGIVSLGMIGRLVCERLQPFDLEIIAYDPFVSPDEAAGLGITLVPLEELFQRADCVSVHTPWLPETEGLITGALLSSMKPYAGFINSSRGAVVNEPELISVARARPDLQFVLDVTRPEPPATDSALYDLDNVVLTPHIAGSLGPECRRMGHYMVDELRRWVNGEPLQWSVSRAQARVMA